MGDIEKHTLFAALFNLRVDSARHNIARCQILSLIILVHELLATLQLQYATKSSHRFRD